MVPTLPDRNPPGHQQPGHGRTAGSGILMTPTGPRGLLVPATRLSPDSSTSTRAIDFRGQLRGDVVDEANSTVGSHRGECLGEERGPRSESNRHHGDRVTRGGGPRPAPPGCGGGPAHASGAITGLLGSLDEMGECPGVVHRQLGEHLAIDLDSARLQARRSAGCRWSRSDGPRR